MISYHKKSCYVFAHFDESDPEEKGKRPCQPHSQHPCLCILIGQIPLDFLQCLLINGMIVWIIRGKYGLAGNVLQVAKPSTLGHFFATDGILADYVGIGTAIFVDDLPVLFLRDIH